MNLELALESRDIDLLVEMNRNGIATVAELAFATGNFSGDIPSRLHQLSKRQAIASVMSGNEINYCVTGTGLEAVYMADAFWKAAHVVTKFRLVDFRPFILEQKMVVKNGGPISSIESLMPG